MSIIGSDSINRVHCRKVALLGFTGAALASLELFLAQHPVYKHSHADQADLLIIHADQGKDPAQLQQYYAHKYAKPGVLVSVRTLSWPGFVSLSKPYTAGQLAAALTNLEQQLGTARPPRAGAAAVMQLKNSDEQRQQVYAAYRQRIDAGRAAIADYQGLKAARRQGKDARAGGRVGRSAAERALQQIQQKLEREHQLKAEQAAARVAGSQAAPATEAARSERNAGTVGQGKNPAAAAVSGVASKTGAVPSAAAADPCQAIASSVAPRAKTVPAAKATRRAPPPAAPVKPQVASVSLARMVVEKKAATGSQPDAQNPAGVIQPDIKQADRVSRKSAEQALRVTTPRPASVGSGRRPSVAEAGQAGSKIQALAPQPKAPEKPSARRGGDSDPSARKEAVALNDEMIYRCCGNLPDVDLSRPDERRRVYFNTEGALLGLLPLAKKKGCLADAPVEIAGLPRLFVYLPAKDVFFGDFGEELLLQFALTRFAYGELDLNERLDFGVAEPQMVAGRTMLEDAEVLIWNIALWTARGRLLSGMDPEKVYRLKKQPDFGRMITTPHAEKISELWYGHRLSAVDVVRILNISQRYVFAFMAGAYTLGWFQE